MTVGKIEIMYHPDSSKQPREIVELAAGLASHLEMVIPICIRSQHPGGGVTRVGYWGIGPRAKDGYLDRSVSIITAMRQA